MCSESSAKPKAVKKVQINFEVSEDFARLIAEEGAKAGSTRRFFARLLREAGYEVPEVDVNPPDNRRFAAARRREMHAPVPTPGATPSTAVQRSGPGDPGPTDHAAGMPEIDDLNSVVIAAIIMAMSG